MAVYFKGKRFDFSEKRSRILSKWDAAKINHSQPYIFKSNNLTVYKHIGIGNKFLLLSMDDKYGIVLSENKTHEIGACFPFDDFKDKDSEIIPWISLKNDNVWQRCYDDEDQIIDELRG